MNDTNTSALSEYSDQKRLAIYKIVTSACTHLYSKGTLQEDKFKEISKVFADIAVNDPIFMVHLAAYSAKNDSKDLKVLTTFFNSLNDANGTPFFKGSSKNKPNFREVSYSVLQGLDPHLAVRVLKLCHKRFGVNGILNDSKHFPTGLKTAFKKYIHYREDNLDMLRGIKKAGLTNKMVDIYRMTRTAPIDEAASILNWKQKDGRELKMENLPDFSTKTSAEIVKELEDSKLSIVVALSIIPKDKITASVAKALMNNCTGNQSIILYNWFSKNGFLDVKSIKDLFKNKIKEATTAIDRIDTLTKNADVQDKKEMSAVRSEKRKEVAGTKEIGKIFFHIDASGSMAAAIEFAKNKASIFAECVNDPSKNFNWGLFGTTGKMLKVPNEFTKEDFHQALYGVTANMGSTDCVALYGKAREFGADVDVYVTDQGHNIGTIHKRIKEYHDANPNIAKPRAAVIVNFGGLCTTLQDSLKQVEIPVAIINPDSLSESALVAQSIRAALVGELAIIEEIMNTPLPSLPKWWNRVATNVKKEEVGA